MAIEYVDAQSAARPTIVQEQLHCALTGRPVQAESAYWAPPLVTARELVATIIGAALHSPATLSQILFAEQPNVPYHPDVREQLAARRTSEQFKLLVGLLLAIALIVVPIVLLAMR